MEQITIRHANLADTQTLRRVFEYASQGLSPYMWEKAVGPDQDFDRFVDARMAAKIHDESQVFKIAEMGGVPVGGILTYAISKSEPLDGASAMMQSFIEIDNLLLGTVYINAIAVFPEFRRSGVASALLKDAQIDASRKNAAISLSVCDANPGAISTYEANDFQPIGKVRMEKEDWQGEGENWLLMVNDRLCPWIYREEGVQATSKDPMQLGTEV